eukprot:10122-Heterococcus_DN1.PRE.2
MRDRSSTCREAFRNVATSSGCTTEKNSPALAASPSTSSVMAVFGKSSLCIVAVNMQQGNRLSFGRLVSEAKGARGVLLHPPYMPALRLIGSCALLLLLASTPSTCGLVNTINSAAVMPLAPKLGLFVADFDDTITIGDTTPLLPLIAAFAAPEDQKTAIETVWGGLTDSFLQSYYGALQTNVANHKDFTLEGFLLALEEAELASIHRVSDSKRWQSISTVSLSSATPCTLHEPHRANVPSFSPADVKTALLGPLRSRWTTQAHAPRCLTRLLSSSELQCTRHILSINFCSDVIRTVLGDALSLCSSLDNIAVHCNDLALGHDGRTTGEVVTNVVGAGGKLRKFQTLAAATTGTGLSIDHTACQLVVIDSIRTSLVATARKHRQVAGVYNVAITPLAAELHPGSNLRTLLAEADHTVRAEQRRVQQRVYSAECWSQIEHLLFGDVPPAISDTPTVTQSGSSSNSADDGEQMSRAPRFSNAYE